MGVISRSRDRGRRRSQRGAVAVEAALVTPILLILLFGIIELALLMRDDVALTSSSRIGGRIASANPGAGAGGAEEGGDCTEPSCSGADAPKLAQLAADAIQRQGSAIPEDSIKALWVYKANAAGYPGAEGNTAWTCTTNCVRYYWMAHRDAFRYVGGTWDSTSINTCPGTGPDPTDDPDAVGVYIRAEHDFLTGLFVDKMDITDHAVFTFEPLPTLNCGPGQHP